jgi:hypothetical protein
MIMFALGIFVLVGILALAVDTGFLMAERRQAQAAADSGALAGAVDLMSGKPGQISTSAKAYGSQNADVPADNVVVRVPPESGPFAGMSGYVQVFVEKDVQKLFLGAVYDGDWKVRTEAVAGVEMEQKPFALLALGCSGKKYPGIYINGTTDLYINGGSVMANCDIDSSGGSNVFYAGGTIDANGTVSGNSNWLAEGGIREGIPTVDDPLEGLAKPPKGTQVTTKMLEDAGFKKAGKKWVCENNETCTLSPGHYLNLDEIQAAGTIVLLPGIYHFEGDTTFSMGSGTSWIKGNGVLLFFANSGTKQASFKPGNGNIELSAPCLETTPSIGTCSGLAAYSGGANGMVLWIDNCTDFISSGNGVFKVEGAIYAPCSHVELHGTPDSNGLQVIVFTLELKGTSAFTINYRDYIEAQTPAIFLVQ